MNLLYKVCLALLIVGGLNWGLVGLFSFNLVGWLFAGSMSLVSRVVYTLVGAAALCTIPALFTPDRAS